MALNVIRLPTRLSRTDLNISLLQQAEHRYIRKSIIGDEDGFHHTVSIP